MWGFLGKLFGTDRAIEKGIETVSNGIDKLVYTDEERADAAAKERTEARGMLIEWMRTTQGQNLARRLLALIITAVWLLMYFVSMALDCAVIWAENAQTITNLTNTSHAIGERATQMNGAMMLILGFYFAAPHMGSIVQSALTKFGGKEKQK